MWSGRPPSGDGIGFCYGTVSIFEKITFGTWTLELSTYRLSGSLQLLPQRCFRVDAFLVSIVFLLCLSLPTVDDVNLSFFLSQLLSN